MSENTTATDSVMIERTFDAPIDLVWELWTQAEHFKNWYGPQGFNLPVVEMDATVGGKRLFCMASPDGSMKMWFSGEYKEVSPTNRLVYTESMSDEEGNPLPASEHNPGTTEVTVLLEDLGGSTKMTMTHAGVPAGSPGEAGWQQAFTKMADYVGTLQA